MQTLHLKQYRLNRLSHLIKWMLQLVLLDGSDLLTHIINDFDPIVTVAFVVLGVFVTPSGCQATPVASGQIIASFTLSHDLFKFI